MAYAATLRSFNDTLLNGVVQLCRLGEQLNLFTEREAVETLLSA